MKTIKLTPEELSYERLKRELAEAPITYLPALLTHFTQTCVQRNVFRDNEAIIRIVKVAILTCPRNKKK